MDNISESQTKEIEYYLDRARARERIPGLSVTLFNTDGIIHSAGLGSRDLEEKQPATPDTIYSIASTTKTFTAMGILSLVDAGKLSLDDPISEYTDFWENAPGDPILVHEVLSNSSGMPEDYSYPRSFLFKDTPPDSAIWSREDFRRHANANADQRITEYDTYMYNGRGYQVLGDIIEQVTGEEYGNYIEQELFDPLNMDRSQVGYESYQDIAEDAATGYHFDEDDVPTATDHNVNEEITPPHSGGGIASTTNDLAKTGQCLLNYGQYAGKRVLDSMLVGKMFANQSPPTETLSNGELGYGFGLKIAEIAGHKVVGHTGTAPGVARSYFGLVPDEQLGVAICVNATDVDIGPIGKGMIALILGHEPEQVVPTYALQNKISAVTGTYEPDIDRLGPTVTVDDTDTFNTEIKITYEGHPGWEITAFPNSSEPGDYSFTTINRHGAKAQIRFFGTDNGMELHINTDRLHRI